MIKRLLATLALVPPVVLQQHTPPSPPGPSPTATATSATTVLRAYPAEGHAGNAIYLAGSGFLPNKDMNFLIACPRWDSNSVPLNGNFQLYAGPRTDPHGQFAGYAIKAIRLHGVDTSPCIIYPRYYDQPFIPESIPASYTILARNQPLKRSDRIIQGVIHAHPKSQKAGLREKIDIANGWGGAYAAITITFPSAKPITITRRLDYAGSLHMQVIVPDQDQRLGVATVSARFHLGTVKGQTKDSFKVVR